MELSVSLSPGARRIATRLLGEWPDFGFSLLVLDNGNFEAHLLAPIGSKAGALIVSTAPHGSISVRLAPPQMHYNVDNETQLLNVVRDILADRAVFAQIVDHHRQWCGTALIPRSAVVALQPGRHANVISWSGQHARIQQE